MLRPRSDQQGPKWKEIGLHLNNPDEIAQTEWHCRAHKIAQESEILIARTPEYYVFVCAILIARSKSCSVPLNTILAVKQKPFVHPHFQACVAPVLPRRSVK